MMKNTLSYENLTKYISIVLDLEKNIYIQEQTLKELYNKANSLGKPKTIDVPTKKVSDFTYGYVAGPIMLVIVLLLGIFAVIFLSFKNQMGIKESDELSVALIIAGIIAGGLIFGLILSAIIFNIEKPREKERCEKNYQIEMENYYSQLEVLKNMQNAELKKREYILSQYDILKKKYMETNNTLQEIYNYDILAEKYRNIIAISSIYEYLETGRCKSLTFNENTGDKGAYNIFEEELRLNKIITNTDIIIQKLDIVINNQKKLQLTMRQATDTINQLITNTNNISNSLERLESNSEIAIYNQQQTNKELSYMNFMNKLYRRY